MRDPYASMARAAMSESAMFHRGQEQLRSEMAQERNPDKRRIIELRLNIEGWDYMAITSDRLAGISVAITGNSNSEQALLDRTRATDYRARAAELRLERNTLIAVDRQREPAVSWEPGLVTGSDIPPDNRVLPAHQGQSEPEPPFDEPPPPPPAAPAAAAAIEPAPAPASAVAAPVHSPAPAPPERDKALQFGPGRDNPSAEDRGVTAVGNMAASDSVPSLTEAQQGAETPLPVIAAAVPLPQEPETEPSPSNASLSPEETAAPVVAPVVAASPGPEPASVDPAPPPVSKALRFGPGREKPGADKTPPDKSPSSVDDASKRFEDMLTRRAEQAKGLGKDGNSR